MKFASIFTSLSAVGLLTLAGTAQAFVVDFENIADTEGEAGYAAWSRTFDGVEITATGTNLAGDQDYYAYLDSGHAGLGVCKVITSSAQCSPSSDDNVTAGELLNLAFDAEVTISNLFFRNGGHGTSFASDADVFISVDNGAYQAYDLVSNFTIPLTGSNFSFYGDQVNQTNGYQFYVSAVTAEASGTPSVPTPAPLALLGIAAFGLGVQSRMRRA